jgi:hypothetical protein
MIFHHDSHTSRGTTLDTSSFIQNDFCLRIFNGYSLPGSGTLAPDKNKLISVFGDLFKVQSLIEGAKGIQEAEKRINQDDNKLNLEKILS